MKNITKQYQDLLEGKMSKDNFMRNVRREFPQWISPVNSFNDAVSILKSKKVLSEMRHFGKWAMDDITPEERAAMDAVVNKDTHDDDAETDAMIAQAQANQDYYDPNYPGRDIEVPADRAMKETLSLEPELEAALKKLDKEDKKSLVFWLKNKLAGKKAEPKTAGIDAQDPYGSGLPIGSNMFSVTEKEALKEAAKKSEGKYKEVTGKAEYGVFPGADHVNYNQLMKGLQYELSKMEEITDEALVKAKQKAVKNLTKDPNAYRDLVVTNVKDTEKKDKDLRMQPVKKDNMVDKANGMKVLEKDAKGNVQDSLGKKERAKSKTGEGVKQLTQTPKKAKGIAQVMEVPGKEKVMALKEHILDELTMQNPNRPQFTSGNRVATKDGKFEGVITKFDGHTATVKLEGDGSERDFQPNVLMHSTGKPQQAQPTMQEDVKFPDLRQMWNNMTPEERVESLKRNKFLGRKTDEVYAELAKLSFEELFFQDTEARKKYGILPYAALLQGLLFPQSTATQSLGEKSTVNKHAALKEKLVKALKKEMLYKDPTNPTAKPVVASSSQSRNALTKAGMQQIPGTQDAK